MAAAEKARKLIDLHNLAVYWDTSCWVTWREPALWYAYCIINQPHPLIECTMIGCINVCQVIGCGFNGPNDL